LCGESAVASGGADILTPDVRMKVDMFSVVMFCVVMAGFLGVIFAVSAFANWLHNTAGRTPPSRLLRELGLPLSNGTVYALKKGRRYVVKRSFVDHHGQRFEVGDGLTFVKKDYLPYHGGHTIFFEERTIYLQDEEQAEILQGLWDYLEPARRG
jgi:hypothetical protein